jgi:hypothetical protein
MMAGKAQVEGWRAAVGIAGRVAAGIVAWARAQGPWTLVRYGNTYIRLDFSVTDFDAALRLLAGHDSPVRQVREYLFRPHNG